MECIRFPKALWHLSPSPVKSKAPWVCKHDIQTLKLLNNKTEVSVAHPVLLQILFLKIITPLFLHKITFLTLVCFGATAFLSHFSFYNCLIFHTVMDQQEDEKIIKNRSNSVQNQKNSSRLATGDFIR